MNDKYNCYKYFAKEMRESHIENTSKDITYSMKRVMKDLKTIYKVEEVYRNGINYIFLDNSTIQFTYVEPSIYDMIDKKWRYQHERTVGINGLYIAENKRGKGYGSEFIRELLYTTERVASHLSYVLMPYLDVKDEEYNVGLGKFYLKCGGKILRSSKSVDRPYIDLNKELDEAGIGPIGFASKRNWGDPEGLSLYVAEPEEWTPLQKKYLE